LLYRKYSAASDVWSYGVLMYEIWSLGHKPFEGYTNNQVGFSLGPAYGLGMGLGGLQLYPSLLWIGLVLQAMKRVERGYRLPPPPGCPRSMYELMIQCW